MSIVTYSFADMGYRRVGPLPPWGGGRDPAGVADLMKERADYEVVSSHWVRRPGRRRGVIVSPLVEVVADFDRDSSLDDGAFSFLDNYFGTTYPEYPKYPGDFADLLRFQNTDAEAQGRHVVFSRLGRAITFAGRNRIKTVLRNHIMPWFLRHYPEGRVAVIRYSYELFQLSSLVRAVYTMSKNSFDDLKRQDVEQFPTLRHWQNGDLIATATNLIELTNVLWYPHVVGYQCGPLGLSFVFLLDPSEEHRPGNFPRDWLAIAESHADFAGQNVRDLEAFQEPEGSAAWRMIHRRYRSPAPPSAAARLNFLRWYVERIDRLLYELADVANFTADNDPDGDVDPELAFEHLLTIARLVRRTLALTTLGAVSARKVTTFEVADIYGTLSKLFGNTGDDVEFFKQLFNTRLAPQTVSARLTAVPGPVGEDLRGRVDALYEELNSSPSKGK